LGESLGGAKDLLEAVSFNKAKVWVPKGYERREAENLSEVKDK